MQPPSDPQIRTLIRAARQTQLSRRSVLTAAGAAAASFALAACTPMGVVKPSAASDSSSTEKTLRWANWPDYLDADTAGGHPSLDAFTKASGISVKYSESITANGSYYDSVERRLARGKDIGADLMVLTDWMTARLIRLGYVQKFTASRLPNAKNLRAPLTGVDFDEGRQRSLPWQSNFAGICWNTEAVPNGIASVSELWDPSFKGRVGVVSEMRDTIGLIMLDNGVDVGEHWGTDAFYDAVDVLKKQVGDGQLAPARNSYTNDLRAGNTVAAICWSGDVALLNAEAGNKWSFAMPDAGGTLFSDDFQVPIGSPHLANAEKLIDYYYQPDVAAEVASWVKTVSPVDGAKEIAATVDPALAANPLVFPDDAMFARAHQFRTLTDAEQQEYQAAFASALLGS
ncbi:ABC transporter substrate-binding protein [Leifsonia sp. Root112D2]|uniref:ABC transporter substrate-binding protein n=1 Tax=Leifsonia sp. Root112D2 TaxID=1736426 RepID=UPI0007003EB1|nr:spermidine/putrescine ABC transporter substrate-binding protein [Leifsonia sp. Root112D2]KQV05212.1 polyamine ABC transporter substrate-binding protein [Leifsonia sp. Root112D2]